VVDLDEVVEDLFLFRQPGRFLRFAPDGGVGELGVNLFYELGLLRYFKETPGDRRFFSSILQKDFLFVPVPWLNCKRFQCRRQDEKLPFRPRYACWRYSR